MTPKQVLEPLLGEWFDADALIDILRDKGFEIVRSPREEEIARVLYEDEFGKDTFADLRMFVDREGIKWPPYSAMPYYKSARAVLSLLKEKGK